MTIMCFRQVKKTLILAFLLATTNTLAQEVEDTSVTDVPVPTETLDNLYMDLLAVQDLTHDLEQRVEKREGIERDVLQERLAQAHMQLMEQGLDYVDRVISDVELEIQEETTDATLEAIEEAEPGEDIRIKKDKIVRAVVADFDPHVGQALAILKANPKRVAVANQWILDSIEFPASDLSAAEQAAAYSHVFDENDQINRLYKMYMESIELSEKMGINTEEELSDLKENLSDRAASIAAFLHIANEDVRAIKAAAAVVTDDPELKAKLSVTEDRVQNIAEALDEVVKMMNKLGIPSAFYSEMVVNATGQITTEAIESGVLARLLVGWGNKLNDMLINEAPDVFLKLLIFLAILWIAKRFAKIAEKLATIAIEKSGSGLSTLLRRMLISSIGNLIFVFGILIALSQIGISLGPVLAGLGVAGFVIGFAMQDVLSNFASGVMVLIYRPFDVGDVVETGGVLGTVSHMSLVNTTILTFDNQNIVIPNNRVWQDIIKNLTYQKTRRVDLMFGISYTDDVDKADAILCDIIDKDERILDEPAPIIKLHELGESSVNFVTRSWVQTDDYWDVYWDTLRAVKNRFDAEGISIPFPQRDLHLDTSKPLSVRIDQGD